MLSGVHDLAPRPRGPREGMSCGYLWFRPRASPGFDGWIMLVHEEFETEDQAIYCEKKRLSSIGGVKEAALRAAGVHAELIGLDVDCGIIYNPPDDGDERLWVLDYFKERMIDFVADDDELVRQLLHHQEAVHGDQESEHQDDAPSPPGGVATADDDSLGGGIDSQSPPPPLSRSPPLPPTPATGASVSLTRRERLRTLWLRTEERAALLLQQRWRALQATEEATSRRLCHSKVEKRKTAPLAVPAGSPPPADPCASAGRAWRAPGGLLHPGRQTSLPHAAGARQPSGEEPGTMLSSSTSLDSPRLTKLRRSPKMASMSRSESLLPARSCSR